MADENEEILDSSFSPSIPFSDPKMIRGLPDPACPVCSGRGIHSSPDGGNRPCSCTIKSFGMKYLTPAYKDVAWDKSFNPDSVRDRNLLIVDRTEAWKSIVKAYLLTTGMSISHSTAAPRHLMQFFLDKSERWLDWSIVNRTQLLIINMGFDIRNSQYGNVISSLITDRTNMGKYTWVVTPRSPSEKVFQEQYSFELSKFLENNMSLVNMVN